jgi:hypothetical protein
MRLSSDFVAPAVGRQRAVVALAILSLTAGFLHATIIDAHRGHGIAAGTFTALAVFQVAWAGLVVTRPSRPVLALGAAANAAVVIGYALSRTTGIGFVDGFEDVEPVTFPDAVATALEVLLVGGALFLLRPEAAERPGFARLSTAGLGLLSLAVAGVGVPAAAAGASAEHAHGGSDDAAAGDHAEAADHAHGAGGGHGAGEHGDHQADEGAATPEQRAAAAKLLSDTKEGLWQWSDAAKAEAAGFRTIGDAGTGNEHLINWKWIDDDTVLDPDHPESLVYRPTPAGRVLEAAMFMVAPGTADADLPDVGGPLTQWHIHDNLCMSPERIDRGAPQRFVVGLTNAEGGCDRGENLPDAQMLHVWVVEHECGPFSSLEGVGAGQAVEEEQDPNADPKCQHSEH